MVNADFVNFIRSPEGVELARRVFKGREVPPAVAMMLEGRTFNKGDESVTALLETIRAGGEAVWQMDREAWDASRAILDLAQS